MVFKLIYGKQIHLTGSQDKPQLSQLQAFIQGHFKTLPSKYTLTYLDEEGDEITLNDQNDYAILLGSQAKTTKIILRELNEDFVDMTAKLTIHELEEPQKKEEVLPEPVEEESRVSEIDESLIEEKLKKMMPDIISQVKSQVSEEMEQSRLSTQPLIEEEKAEPRKMEEPVPEGPVVHRHIICDNCSVHGLVGIRYKCAVCPDFDLCESCESTSDHPHPFLKIKTLQQTPLKIITILDNGDQQSTLEFNGMQIPIPQGLEGLAQQGMAMFKSFINPQQCRSNTEGCSQQSPRQNCHEFWKKMKEGCMSEENKEQWAKAKEEWKKKKEDWMKMKEGCMQGENKEEWAKKMEEWAKKKAEWGCQGRKWGYGWGKCPYRKNKPEEQPEEKPEMKPEMKEEKVEEPVMKEEEAPLAEVSYEEIIDRANYLVQVFGYDFPKCMKWAQEYAQLSREELLNYCLEDRTFHQ